MRAGLGVLPRLCHTEHLVLLALRQFSLPLSTPHLFQSKPAPDWLRVNDMNLELLSPA